MQCSAAFNAIDDSNRHANVMSRANPSALTSSASLTLNVVDVCILLSFDTHAQLKNEEKPLVNLSFSVSFAQSLSDLPPITNLKLSGSFHLVRLKISPWFGVPTK